MIDLLAVADPVNELLDRARSTAVDIYSGARRKILDFGPRANLEFSQLDFDNVVGDLWVVRRDGDGHAPNLPSTVLFVQPEPDFLIDDLEVLVLFLARLEVHLAKEVSPWRSHPLVCLLEHVSKVLDLVNLARVVTEDDF